MLRGQDVIDQCFQLSFSENATTAFVVENVTQTAYVAGKLVEPLLCFVDSAQATDDVLERLLGRAQIIVQTLFEFAPHQFQAVFIVLVQSLDFAVQMRVLAFEMLTEFAAQGAMRAFLPFQQRLFLIFEGIERLNVQFAELFLLMFAEPVQRALLVLPPLMQTVVQRAREKRDE